MSAEFAHTVSVSNVATRVSALGRCRSVGVRHATDRNQSRAAIQAIRTLRRAALPDSQRVDGTSTQPRLSAPPHRSKRPRGAINLWTHRRMHSVLTRLQSWAMRCVDGRPVRGLPETFPHEVARCRAGGTSVLAGKQRANRRGVMQARAARASTRWGQAPLPERLHTHSGEYTPTKSVHNIRR